MSRKSRVAISLIAPMLFLCPVLYGNPGGPVLMWHTYAGSSVDDQGEGVAVDADGNVYLVGWSDATWGSPLLPHSGAGRDAFVAKLNHTGALEWNTFLGQAPQPWPNAGAITVDGSGDVYVVATILDPEGGGGSMVAKLNSAGTVQWQRFLSGQVGRAIVVDAVGKIYVGGWGYSVWETDPVEPFPAALAAFVAKLNPSGTELWHAFLGSGVVDEFDSCTALAVDASANVYVTGRSTLSWGAPIDDHTGDDDADAYVAKLNSDGYLQWNTFMGAPGGDSGWGIDLDGDGLPHVAGDSEAAWGEPIVAHASGSGDAFVAKLNADGSRQWHTFMGAASMGWAIAVGGNHSVYVTGVWADEPLTHPGGFVAALNSDGVLQWNMFLEAILDEMDLGGGNVYASGQNDVDWGTPVAPYAGGWDAFVAKIQAVLEIQIDIKPGSDPNCFNIDGHGVIPVAINGSANFDVHDIDVTTLTLDGLQVRGRGQDRPLCSIEDWNGDTFFDLVCHFEDDPGDWTGGMSTATLTGSLLDGTEIAGTDSICMIP